jgi:nucleoid-associated protein YgaU
MDGAIMGQVIEMGRITKRKYILKSKRRFFTFILLFTLMLAGIFACKTAYGFDETANTTIIVKSGDTLWSIAKSNYAGGDIRRHIYDIQKANDLVSSCIQPGDELVIPN